MNEQSKVDNNSIKIIGLSMVIILIVGFSIFFFTIQSSKQILEKDVFFLHQSFLSQLDLDTDKIFIIGSSHVNAIDPNLIQEQLSNIKYDFDVYNLSLGGYSLEARSKTIDLIIDAKPKIIIFGISEDDFANELRKVDIKLETPKSIFPNPQDSFNYILTDSFLEKHDFLQSPRYFLMNALSIKFNSFNAGEIAIISENIPESKMPFFIPSEKNYVVMKNIDIRNDFDRKAYPISPLEDNKKLIIFKNMLEKFEENNIKVIIFTTPFNEVYFETYTGYNKKPFDEIIENISNEFDLEIHVLTEKYSKLEIWNDYQHIALGLPSKIYTEDITKIIIDEIKK